MKGKILNFDATNATGVIAGDDGNRYNFQEQQWKSTSKPRNGQRVDFSPNNTAASEIYADGAVSTGTSKKVTAALFAFFLGAFGGHKFYLGYTKQGIIMLLTFILGFVLLGIPSIVIGVIAFVEFILYLTKSDDDFEQTYVLNRKPWF